jgi:hypothetical protein
MKKQFWIYHYRYNYTHIKWKANIK